jgi:hypothetical protein
MRTTDEMLARELAPQKGRDHDGILEGRGEPANAQSNETDTILDVFCSGQDSVQQIVDAAKIVTKLGYVPEIRLSAYSDGSGCIELYVRDIPSLISTLRASLEASNGRKL